MSLLNAQGKTVVPDKPKIRVAIGIPTRDNVKAAFSNDLTHLVGNHIANNPQDALHVMYIRGTLLPEQRAHIVDEARKLDATHILWLDDDMGFPPDTLQRLLDHNQPIVAANAATRHAPVKPVAWANASGERLYVEASDTGLRPVYSVGMAVMLTQIDVFAKVPEPWFMLGFNPKTRKYISEDFYFCGKAAMADFPILVDLDLSKEIDHHGEWAYKLEHALAYRDAAVKEEAPA